MLYLVIRKACLTYEILRRKGKIILPWYSLCGMTGEINSHLFLRHTFTAQVCSKFLNSSEMKCTMPEHTANLTKVWSIFFFLKSSWFITKVQFGPTQTLSFPAIDNLSLFFDCCTRMTWLYLLKPKVKFFPVFNHFIR